MEQIITLHEVDYYMMRGVSDTAFTEALAYIFQERYLEQVLRGCPGCKRSNLAGHLFSYDFVSPLLIGLFLREFNQVPGAAVGSEISIEPVLLAAAEALNHIK